MPVAVPQIYCCT